jgi:O-antigen/teichoic acid export membrane protein
VAVIVSPILAYVMGPPEFGRLASAIALHQVLIVVAIFGLDQAVVLQRVEAGTAATARGLIAVGIAISAVFTVAVGLTGTLWAPALGFGGFSSLVLATILWTAPGAAVQIMLALLLTEDRLRPFAMVSALSAVGGQVFGIGLLFGVSRTADTYAWGGVISQFAAMAIGLIATRPALRGLIDWAVTWRAIKLGLPLAMTGIAGFVLNAGDRIVIQRDLGAEQVGRYQVAYTLGYVVVLLLVFTGQSWIPRFAAVRDEGERWALIARSRDELYRLLVPMILGLTLAAPLALRIVAPASFRPDGLLLVVFLVAVSAVPVAASGATGRALIAARRPRPLALAAVVAALANVALNIVAVPVFGIEGSAAATVVAFAIQAVIQRSALPRSPQWPGIQARTWMPVALACLISGCTVALPQTPLWNALRLAVAVACLPWFLRTLLRARRSER